MCFSFSLVYALHSFLSNLFLGTQRYTGFLKRFYFPFALSSHFGEQQRGIKSARKKEKNIRWGKKEKERTRAPNERERERERERDDRAATSSSSFSPAQQQHEKNEEAVSEVIPQAKQQVGVIFLSE